MTRPEAPGWRIPAALLLLAAPLASCHGGTEPVPFTETLDIAACDPAQGGFTTTIDNPYFPLAPNAQWVLEGDDNGTRLQVTVTVLDSSTDVAGVMNRILEERETANGSLVEVSHNFFVQNQGGDVCYYGEDVDIYQNGVVVSHGGAWRAGVNGALPGIFMPASPTVGMGFRQEVAPGVAEDRVTITAVGDTVTVPAGTFTRTVRFLESTPLEPGARSRKVFAQGLGLIVDDKVRLVGHTP
jgi:hypothetical protein